MSNAIRSFLLLLAPAILYAEAGIVSLRPLYTPETAVLNPVIVDLWSTGNPPFQITFRVEPDGDTGYRVSGPEEQFAAVHLVQLGGETIADIVFIQEKSFFPQLSVHYFARLRVEGNTLHVDWLGGEALVEQMERSGSPRFERLSEKGWDEDFLVLTGSTAELRQFVLDCLKRPDAFFNPNTYERAGPEERAADWNERSWAVVSGRASPEAYGKAWERAEEAVRLASDDPDYWNTLAAARYRVGRFSEALAALARAGQLRNADSPEDLVFGAMAHYQLGEKQAAKKLLGQVQKMLGDARYREDQERLRLLHEAEELIAPKGK
jgi:hypothetical protein